MQLDSMFICNWNIALHVSDASCVHLQEHLGTVEAASDDDMRRGEVTNRASKVVGIHLTKAVLAKRYFRVVSTLPRAQKVSGLKIFHTVGYHTTWHRTRDTQASTASRVPDTWRHSP